MTRTLRFATLLALCTPAAVHAQMDPAAAMKLVSPAGISFAQSSVDVPIDLSMGRPVVKVRIGDKGPYRFILDTGAGASLIDSTIATALALTVVGPARVGSPGGGALITEQLSAPTFTLEGAELKDVNMLRADLRTRFNGQFDGVLSYRTLGAVLVSFDYTRGVVRLERGRLDAGAPNTVAYTMERGPIRVPVTVAGRSVTLALDSGAGDAFTLPKSVMTEVPLGRPATPAGERRTLTGTMQSWKAQLSGTISVAGHESLDPDISFIDGDGGTIGGDFFRKFVVTIDAANRLVRFTPK